MIDTYCVRVRSLGRSLWRETEAAIAPIFAIILVIVFGVGLLTLDVTRMMNVELKARQIADAAALHAAGEIRKQISEGFGQDLDQAGLEQIATRTFVQHLVGTDIKLKSLELDYIIDAGEHFVDLDYRVEIGKLVEGTPIEIGNTTIASVPYATQSLYMYIDLLIDVSGSMSTGATVADQVGMWQKQKCSFACHEATIEEAQSYGFEMRFDTLLASLNLLIDQARFAIDNLALSEDAVQFQFFYFKDRELQRSADYTNVSWARQHLNQTEQNYPRMLDGHTNLDYALNRLRTHHLPQNGSGTAADDRKNFVFMITDGMGSDGGLNYVSDAGVGTLQQADCEAMKATGTILSVILLDYPNYAETMRAAYGTGAENNHSYDSRDYAGWSENFDYMVGLPQAHVQTEMRNCASPDFYFEASNRGELDAAMRQFFANAVNASAAEPRLSYIPETDSLVVTGGDKRDLFETEQK